MLSNATRLLVDIMVAPGTYRGLGNQNLSIPMDGISVRSINGSDETVIEFDTVPWLTVDRVSNFSLIGFEVSSSATVAGVVVVVAHGL
jgi:hypothetical protein